MAQNWLNTIMTQEEICTEGVKPYATVNTSEGTAIITLGNSTSQIYSFWWSEDNQNLETFLNTINTDQNIIALGGATLTDGILTSIVSPQTVIFSRGENPICYTEPDFFNTKEDQEVLQGLFCGRNAHEQKHDVHTIKQLKIWKNV